MNSKLRKLLRQLEGHEFVAAVNVASDFATAQRIIRRHPTTRRIARLIAEENQSITDIVNAIRRITRRAIDPRYESPSDVALAVLLYLLADIDKATAAFAATLVLRAPQTWWARRQASAILSAPRLETRTTDTPIRIAFQLARYVGSHRTIDTALGSDLTYDLVAMPDFTVSHAEWPVAVGLVTVGHSPDSPVVIRAPRVTAAGWSGSSEVDTLGAAITNDFALDMAENL